MLNWCNRFNICCFLDNHQYNSSHHTVEVLAAAGALHSLSLNAGTAFDQLCAFSQQHNDWLFGHFAYDLKNEIEDLHSSQPDGIGFPDLFFYVPEVVLQLSGNQLVIGSRNNDHHVLMQQISAEDQAKPNTTDAPAIHQRFSHAEYLNAVEKLRAHILRGDCYEINLCQEFYSDHTLQDPLQLYRALSHHSPNPFSAYYRLNHLYLSCMSPERFLKKEGNRVLSQPMKGTAGRNLSDPAIDRANAQRLAQNEKERAENIMVVDLVRNDLSRICVEGTVQVDELCKVYTFPQVHQMISTVSGQLKAGIRWTDAVKATFPMGSMTGAPKKRVMELIEQFERSKRGLFSGSIGYLNPSLDFDFNVVIRSVLYNSETKYLSFHTGSAITFKSNAEEEYEECQLKAGAIKKALAETNTFH